MMKYRKTIIVVALIAIALIAIFAYRGGGMPAGEDAEIVIDTPASGATVSSPLTVRGKARGSWFFEANIRADLLDADGNLIVQGHGTAEGEWMTTDFVPFTAELEFVHPKTATGTLRILNDNPSGLPENEKSFDVPVRFGIASDTVSLKIFFGNSGQDPQGLACEKTYPAVRIISKTQGVARASLDELLKGPTEEEKNNGYFSSLPEGVKIQSIAIQNGVLAVDFNEALNNVGGSCRVLAIRSQITETLKQFPTVQEVRISIDGRTEDILQP